MITRILETSAKILGDNRNVQSKVWLIFTIVYHEARVEEDPFYNGYLDSIFMGKSGKYLYNLKQTSSLFLDIYINQKSPFK